MWLPILDSFYTLLHLLIMGFNSSYLNHFCALGRRWGQPGQQQGRFLPSTISSLNRLICSVRVFSCFTIVVQQIHSLRASGVNLFHFSNSAALERNTCFKSSGTSCTTPSSIAMFVILPIALIYSRSFVGATFRLAGLKYHETIMAVSSVNDGTTSTNGSFTAT